MGLRVFTIRGIAIGLLMLAGVSLAGCGQSSQGAKDTAPSGPAPKEMTEEEITASKSCFTAGASVHDPSILQVGDTYYIFGSHMESATTTDLRNFKTFSTGVDANNPLFSNLFGGEEKAFAFTGKNESGGYSVWAPDVIYNKKMKKYVMYFCTSATYKKSSLCFATSDKPEGPYEVVDVILDSGFNYKTVNDTDFYEYHDKTELNNYLLTGDYDNLKWPNCIDPTVFYDKDGKMWMTYGSWSGGIFLLEIDEATGYPIHPEENEQEEVDSYFGRKLLGGGHNSIEGPYILYDEASDYYYLFVSYGALQAKGGYQIRLFRSKNVEGPYEDPAGQTLGTVVNHEGYGLKMMGNYTFPDLAITYMAPGHNSAFIDEKDGKMYVVYHQRFKNGTEAHEPRVHQLFTNEDGWLVAAPFATDGETLPKNGYAADWMTGTYYMVNHGTDISREVHKPVAISLTADGNIAGEVTGTYAITENTPYITLTIDGVSYKGVLVRMTDEAGNDTMCFTAAGDNNETIWGVHYFVSEKDAATAEEAK